MADDDKKPPFDLDRIKDEFNRKALMAELPSSALWSEVLGVRARSTDDGRHLVSIQGRNPQGEMLTMWTDLPNAMYLFAQLRQVQATLNAPVPLEKPARAKGHPH